MLIVVFIVNSLQAMEAERNRQYKAGEVKEKYAPPPDPRAY